MKQLILTTIILSVLWGCGNLSRKNNSIEIKDKFEKEAISENLESDSQKNEWDYQEVKRNYIDLLMLDICITQDIEIIDLYPILDSIASDEYENLILVDSIRAKGFEVTNWSRGNWMEGPRIVSFTMSNEECECQVDKLYYSTEQKGKYKVTERIKCKKVSI